MRYRAYTARDPFTRKPGRAEGMNFHLSMFPMPRVSVQRYYGFSFFFFFSLFSFLLSRRLRCSNEDSAVTRSKWDEEENFGG